EPFVLEETTLRFGFDFGAAELDQSSQDYLDELARALNDNPALEVELSGHTDDIGSHKFNMRLSFDRANTLKDELIRRGIDETRITVYGKGETEPLNENKTDQERAENRRVEMRILYPN
ncbi:MAG TPA: OmpA family protein, partial [Ohtaekwangia sp.]|nr:OmpA family protein [Ohtaekwangia sp.]